MNSSAGADNSTHPWPPGPEVPDFELIRPIGEGGFGRVWLARNKTTGRLRAIKLIDKSLAGTADRVGREMASITRLEANLRHHHPNLLTIHHVGQTDEHLFYVMDLADDASIVGKMEPDSYEPNTLRRRLDDGAAETAECTAWARQLLEGLASLHEAGMVHRDVKPANCLLVEGQLRLADFGLLTQSGSNISRIGTVKYMPPDGRMDTQADVYAAGLVIYELLTGFSADRFPQLGDRSTAVLSDPALSALMNLVLEACSPDRDKRFSDARKMLTALDERLNLKTPLSANRTSRWQLLIPIVVATLMPIGVLLYLNVANRQVNKPVVPVDRVDVNFISYPFEATIEVDGRELHDEKNNLLLTPNTARNLPLGKHHVVFRHPDYAPIDMGQVDFGTTRQVVGDFQTAQSSSDE